jgi:hypothetical protein
VFAHLALQVFKLYDELLRVRVQVDLAQVFATVERAKSRLQIQAWGIANTTLEDVFVKISKEAQLGERALS